MKSTLAAKPWNSEVTRWGKLMVFGQLSAGESVGDWTHVVILTIPDVPKVQAPFE